MSAPAVESTTIVESNPGHDVDPPDSARFSLSGFRLGVRQTLPLLPSTLLIGVVFGVLARQVGISLPAAALMSTTVFSGAAQFVAIGLWTSPLPIATLILSTFILSLRHVLMGATLRPWFRPLSTRQAYASIATLTDESWALTTAYIAGGGTDRAFLAGSGLTLGMGWVSGTIIGQVAGSQVPDPARFGLDFAFTAALLALLIPLWRGRHDALPWVTAGIVATLCALWLPGTWHVIIGGLAGTLVAGVRGGERG